MTASVVTRPAMADDLEAMLELADARRQQYATYQPRFWRPAPDAVARQRLYYAELIDDHAIITVVATAGQVLVGFAIGSVVPAPPVYDPGGSTCLVDDFAVADPDLWSSVGVDLLGAVGHAARRQGANQIVVITGHLDSAKQAALQAQGLTIASEWWVGPLTAD